VRNVVVDTVFLDMKGGEILMAVKRADWVLEFRAKRKKAQEEQRKQEREALKAHKAQLEQRRHKAGEQQAQA